MSEGHYPKTDQFLSGLSPEALLFLLTCTRRYKLRKQMQQRRRSGPLAARELAADIANLSLLEALLSRHYNAQKPRSSRRH